jgi:hypothetical protein
MSSIDMLTLIAIMYLVVWPTTCWGVADGVFLGSCPRPPTQKLLFFVCFKVFEF